MKERTERGTRRARFKQSVGGWSLDSSLEALQEAAQIGFQAEKPVYSVIPPVPESLAETGIAPSIVEQLILKFLYFRGELLGRDIAGLLGLQFSLIDDTLETLKRQHLVGVKKSLGMGNSSGLFM